MAAPLRYFVNQNLVRLCQKSAVKSQFGATWSVVSRLLHRNSELPSTGNALKQNENRDVAAEESLTRAVIDHAHLASQTGGRLFAVVSVAGKQQKVTQDDLIIVENIFPPTVGDRIRLEKVLLVGGKDFTMIGRPILGRDQVVVEAVVVEKTLDVPKPVSYYRPRRNFFRFKLSQAVFTVLRINKIRVLSVDQ